MVKRYGAFRSRRQRLGAVAQNPSLAARITIAVHILTQQLSFAVTGFQPVWRDLTQDAVARTASFGSACKRNHSISAALIATLDDRYVGPVRIVPLGEGCIEISSVSRLRPVTRRSPASSCTSIWGSFV